MSLDPASGSAARHYVIGAIKLAVSIILLTLLFSKMDVGRLWTGARQAWLAWLAAALAIYFVNVLVSIWRWHVLLHAQDVDVGARSLLGSFLVALFFNNFLPSNIGGDVIRIGETARPAGSKTVATLVVLADRVLGLMALVLVAALCPTAIRRTARPPPLA